MKKITLFLLFVALFTNSCLAHNDWMPVQTIPSIPNIVSNESIYTPSPRPVLYYQWVPNVVMRPIVVEQKRIFVREQHIQMVPVTEWVPNVRVLYVWP